MTDNVNTQIENNDSNRPDYVVKQYRQIQQENGLKTRKERIGVAWIGGNDEICLRLNGAQLIEGDLYLYPLDQD